MAKEDFLLLVRKIKEGDESAISCLHNNLRGYIYKIWSENYSDFLSFDDAFDVSFLAIYEAAQKFDFDKGTQFEAYVKPFIKSEIIDEINAKRGIVMPEKIKRSAPIVYEITQEFFEEHEGEELSNEEIRVILQEKGIDLTINEIEECRFFYQSINAYSLDSDSFYETSENASFDEYSSQSIFDIVQDAAGLDDREKRIVPYINEHFELEIPLKELASREHVSVDIARNIVESCFAKIKKKGKKIRNIYNGKAIKKDPNSNSLSANPFEYEYEFTDEDRKRIGNNIKAIREAHNCNNSIEFYEFLNRPQKLSAKTLYEMERGEYKQLSKSKIFDIARLTGQSYELIVFNDLNDILEKDLFDFDDSVHPLDIYRTLEPEEYDDMGEILFPIFTSENAKKEDDFCAAMSLWEEAKNDSTFDEGKLQRIIALLEKAFEKNNLPEACANTLSILEWCFFALIVPTDEKIKEMLLTDYDNQLDYTSRVARDLELINHATNGKKEFFERYDECLAKNMARLTKFNEYRDFLDYFLALRYANAVMDNNKAKLSDEEMFAFGVSLMQSLNLINNKYANKYHKYLESHKKS